jgi:ADP-heptose:LPS heptosyltransferase
LRNHLSPGDVLVMSAAIESLHQTYPGKYLTDVDTSANAIYESNPHVVRLDRSDPAARTIQMHYPLIHESDLRAVHFLQGYIEFLGKELGVPLKATVNRPALYLSDQEKSWVNQVQEITRKPTRFWLVNAGTKSDFTAKAWGHHNYQEVVDRLRGRIQFVQVGEAGHRHRALDGVIDLIGKTDTRQFIRLCWHAQGGLGPSTFLQHICAAFNKPYVCLLGGREPLPWVHYPTQTTLSTLGTLSCCKDKACWRSRVVALGDGDSKDRPDQLCEQPVFGEEPIPRCLALISPQRVVEAIEGYYVGGVLTH